MPTQVAEGPIFRLRRLSDQPKDGVIALLQGTAAGLRKWTTSVSLHEAPESVAIKKGFQQSMNKQGYKLYLDCHLQVVDSMLALHTM